MGYYYRSSGYAGCDYLVVTQKGMTEGRLPKGVVFLTGMMYSDKDFINWMKNDPKEGLHIYVAKHSDNLNEFTHIQENGVFNRFGYFVTKTKMKFEKPFYRIESKWFKRKHVDSFEEALKDLD